VTLPEAENTDDKPDTADQIVVHVDAKSRYWVNGKPQPTQEDVIVRLQTVLETAADRTVYLKGDQNAPYGSIMKMMDALRKSGIETVGLITERRGGNLPSERGGQ